MSMPQSFATVVGIFIFHIRRSDTKGKSLNPADQQYFEDIYIAKWNPKINDWDSTTDKLENLILRVLMRLLIFLLIFKREFINSKYGGMY